MDKIQQAIQFAKQNPDSSYATELRKRIESGQLDKELSRAGLSETYNRPYVPTVGEKIIGGTKAAIGGIASGVGGAVLTAEDYLARKAVNALPEGATIAGVSKEQMQQNLTNAPKLQDQLKQQFGGNENPAAFGVGQLGGEIATLAAPVGAIGKATQSVTKALGAKPIASKLAQAGAEGLAFTAGQSAIEGEKQSLKDYAINAGLNMVFPAAGAVVKKVGETAPARIINSLIKPLQKDFAYGKNPGKTVAELGITANDFDGLITGIKNAKTSVGENIGTLTQKALPQLQSQMDLNTYLTPIDEALAIANKSPRTNATVISRLESVKADLVDNVNRGIDPQSFKGLVGDLTRWTGNASDDAIVNKALKQVYGKTSSGMDTVLKDTLSPEEFAQYKKSAEQYGNLISAENAATYRDNIVKRADLVSFGAKNSALIAALGTAVASGGGGLTTILAGLAGAGIDKAMATPAFKTRLASLLSKLAPKEVQTFFDRVPGAKTLYRQEQIDNLVNQAKKNLKNPSNSQGGFLDLGTIPENGKTLYHGGSKIDEIKLGKSNFQKTFYMSDNPEYAKSYGGKNSVLNEISLSNDAKLADMRNPSDTLINQIRDKIESKPTGKTVKITRPDGSIIEIPEVKGGKQNAVFSTKDIIQGIKDGKAMFAELPEVKKALKELGYDGQITKEVKNGSNYGVWNKNVVKVKSPENSLIQEAKKYKSAEEFVRAQGTPVYHGSTVPIKTIDTSRGYGLYGKGFYVSENQKSANLFGQAKKGGVVSEIVVSPNAKFINMKTPKDYDEIIKKVGDPYKWMIKNGYDGINVDGFAKVIVNPDVIKTKSQLEEIWKKANNKK